MCLFSGALGLVRRRFSVTLPRSASDWRRIDALDVPTSIVCTERLLTTAVLSATCRSYSCGSQNQLSDETWRPRTESLTVAKVFHNLASHSSKTSKNSAACASPIPRSWSRFPPRCSRMASIVFGMRWYVRTQSLLPQPKTAYLTPSNSLPLRL